MSLVASDDFFCEVRLGGGSFGEVFKASWRRDDRSIAVKRLRTPLNDALRAAFVKEATDAEHTTHPNLIRVLGHTDGRDGPASLIMELADGGSLYQALHVDHRQLNERQIAHDIVAGLAFLHTEHPVLPTPHGDLHSLNVLLTADRQHAKLSDSGLSAIKAAGKSTLRSESPVEVVMWAAPEVLLDDPHGVPADIYSLGMLLYELVARRLPFAGKNVLQVVDAVTRKERPELPVRASEPWSSLIEACWAHYPKDRPNIKRVADRVRGLPALSG